jgi:hypothetical protein
VNATAAAVLIRAKALDMFLPLLKQLLLFWKNYSSVSAYKTRRTPDKIHPKLPVRFF